ncbi:hypothetical protein D0C36_04750 [Mucilaginibacter conchicola]|uniref:O-antigen ligase domain-containing protein n=1 Tax=Mucilaginibacter conchicola TaxID=2303333 RepID=A0A372NXK6_9SPHI|nr:hypothetical protein [Mucilaginibacter conchicola]RFZ94846.1 hypothetical protein D0C36_04750 [Mucilaginibacter conchicola]
MFNNVPIESIGSYVNKRQIKALNFFWIGIAAYTLCVTYTGSPNANYTISQAIQSVAIVCFMSAAIFIADFKIKSVYLRVTYILYLFWLLTVISRGFVFNVQSMKDYLFDGWFGIFAYFVPLVLLFPQNILSYKKAFNVIVILGIFYLFYDALFIKGLINRDISNTDSRTLVEYFTKNLALPCTFLLLCLNYQSKKVKIFVWLIAITGLLFAILRARRGLIFTLACPMLFAYIIYVLQSKKKFILVLFSALMGAMLMVFGIAFFNNSSLFHSVKERKDEDTRTPVEDCFYSDMQTTDWIIGRGLNGNYYCPNIDEDDKTGFRSVIETDYLNIILKGGIISLGLLLAILIPAVIKGLFFSKNQLAKAAGVWILLWIVSLYPTTGFAFNLNYILVWLAVGICYNKSLRETPENVMQAYFKIVEKLPQQFT